MKTFTPFPLANYWTKVLGLVLFSLAALLGLLLYIVPATTTLLSYPFDQQVEAVGWILGLGMFFIAISKEKLDDERVAQIRAASYRITFSILSLSVFFWGARNIRELGSITFDPLLLFISYLGTYLLVFYLGILRDPKEYYGAQDGAQNWKNDRWVRILALVVGLCMVGLIVWTKWVGK